MLQLLSASTCEDAILCCDQGMTVVVLTCFASPKDNEVTLLLYCIAAEVCESAERKPRALAGAPKPCNLPFPPAKGDGGMGSRRANSLSRFCRTGDGLGLCSTFCLAGKARKNLFLIGSQSMPCGTGKGGGAIRAWRRLVAKERVALRRLPARERISESEE